MISPVLHQEINVVYTPLDVIVVDRDILAVGVIPDSHPLSKSVRPVLEIVLIFPLSSVSDARVIKAILRAFHCVDIEEHFDLVLFSGIEKPLNLISSSFHASYVRSIRTMSPITNRKPDNFNFTLSKASYMLFSYPGIPMSSHQLVTFNRS